MHNPTRLHIRNGALEKDIMPVIAKSVKFFIPKVLLPVVLGEALNSIPRLLKPTQE